MSLLKRIESARPGGPGEERLPAPAGPSGGAPEGGAGAGAPAPAPRLVTQLPARESFRDVKFRIQTRVIQDLDPKLDLTNQVEVRRQIEEIFSRVIDEEGLALTRAERVRMLEQITDRTQSMTSEASSTPARRSFGRSTTTIGT
jgi:pilus assembly protein CpaF